MRDKKSPQNKSKGEVNDFVYKSLKELILSGHLRPGNRLVHQELGDRFSVSRTPVREALERLFQEGYAGRRPRRGFFVAEFDTGDIRDLYGIREALEIFAYDASCAMGIHNDDLVELVEICHQYAQMFPGSISRARLELDQRFHLKLASLCGNQDLCRTLELVFEKISLKRCIAGNGLAVDDDPLEDHRLLISAITEGRYDGGREILRRHIHQACNRFIRHLEQGCAL
jgi:DNA-binding GntR family transcriptional regulator